MTEFKVRLMEKQKLRFSYWISEKQLRRYAKKAFQKEGITGEILLELLERRLDAVVYRMGFAPTIPAGRQMVVHGHIEVNGQKVDRPSYLVRKGDIVSVRERSRNMALIQDALARSDALPKVPYLEVDKENRRARVVSAPEREQIPVHIDENLVVEYYTKYL
jgi:small subunit ribosomal protein S4